MSKTCLAHSVTACLGRADRHSLISLAGARRLGVWHPAMARALGVSTLHRNEPWWLDLAEGWQQLSPAWRAPLRSARGTRDIDPASLTTLADYVSSQGAGDRALELYMEAKEIDRAADTAVNVAGDLASTGSWATLARLGQTLARDGPAAGRNAQPRHVAKHTAAPWWRRRLTWFARRSSGLTGRAAPREPVQIAEASGAQIPPALPASLAPPDAHWLEPLPRPAVVRTTVRKVTPRHYRPFAW